MVDHDVADDDPPEQDRLVRREVREDLGVPRAVGDEAFRRDRAVQIRDDDVVRELRAEGVEILGVVGIELGLGNSLAQRADQSDG